MTEHDDASHREKLLRDTFTPAENLLFGTIIALLLISGWGADPRSYWILGALLIVGCFTPVILKTHEHTHPFFIDLLWPRFWLLSAPVWIAMLQFSVGIFHGPIKPTLVDEVEYFTLQDTSIWLPVTTSPGSSWLPFISFCSIYLLSISIYLVPKSRSFFERLLPKLCLSAVVISIFGYIQKTLNFENALFTRGTGRTDFFAFFPYDGQWAAFALIWSVTCCALALLCARYDSKNDFLQTTGPWYLTGAVILGSSGFIVESKWSGTILLGTFAWGMLIFSLNMLNKAKEKHRISITTFSAFISIGSFSRAIIHFFNAPDPLAEQSRELRESAYQMFQDMPLFGWGMDSFESLLPFYASDSLVGARYERANSDLLQLLTEFGIIGLLPTFIVISYLLGRYLLGKQYLQLTNHLFIGCTGVLAIAAVDTPLMSPTVYISLFVILLSGLRWADLSRHKIDEVDARPNLVTSSNLRTVPFVTAEESKKETFK